MARIIYSLTSSTRSKVILTTGIVVLILSAVGLSQALSWFRPPAEAVAAIPTWEQVTGDLPADADNAALPYEHAFSLLDAPWPEAAVVGDVVQSGERPDESELAALAELLDGADEGLAIVHEAASRPDCAFPLVPRDGLAGDFPHLRGANDVLLLEIARAFVLTDQGDVRGALDGLADALHCARNAARGMPALKSFLHEARAVELVSATTRIILRDASVTPADVDALSAALRRIDLEADLVTCMRAEGAWGLAIFDAARGRVEGRAASVLRHGVPGWEGQPLPGLYVDANRKVYVEEMARTIHLASRPYRASTALLAESARQIPDYARMADMMLPSPKVPMLRRDEAIAWQRMCLAALEIAVREDAPELLADLPTPAGDAWMRDTFSGDLLRYERTAEGFALYSLGRDLDDDGGVPQQHIGVAECEGDLVWSAGA